MWFFVNVRNTNVEARLYYRFIPIGNAGHGVPKPSKARILGYVEAHFSYDIDTDKEQAALASFVVNTNDVSIKCSKTCVGYQNELFWCAIEYSYSLTTKPVCSIHTPSPFFVQDAFREFLRIRSVSAEGSSGAYELASKWIVDYTRNTIGLASVQVMEYVKGKPVVTIEWPGSQPQLPRILLNSHYDVVPAMQEYWDTCPFAAARDHTSGRIYGRGTQDMKCVCVQYLTAIARLRRAGFKPIRTVYLSFVPDEEIGGFDGINRLLASDEWKSIQPVGLALDEGLANPKDAFTVFYGERLPWWLLVRAEGSTGHGSRFIKGTAVEKLMTICNKALAFRKEQEEALGHTGGCSHASAKKLGDVTTLNLTMLKAGVPMPSEGGGQKGKHERYALNVIPTEARAGFDVRINPQTRKEDLQARLEEWCSEEGVSWEVADWTTPLDAHYLTSVDREKNPWWGVFLVSSRSDYVCFRILKFRSSSKYTMS